LTVHSDSLVRSALLLAVAGLLLMLVFAGGCPGEREAARAEQTPGDPDRGAEIMAEHGCPACHVIPGVRRAEGTVGPPLDFWAERHFIVGTLQNEYENLVTFLQNPQAVRPGSAMPTMAITPQDAEDMAAYLFTLRR
jgi:cytochrome c